MDIFFIEHSYPTAEMYENGVKVILYFGERENPNAKIINDNFRSEVNKQIKLHDAYEAILIDRNGYITEGSKSNIFMIKDNIIMTSPQNAVLPGITRDKIIEVAKEEGFKVEEIEYHYKKISESDAMFISGTSPKILPIAYVDEIKFNMKNNLVIKLMKSYNKKIEENMKNIT